MTPVTVSHQLNPAVHHSPTNTLNSHLCDTCRASCPCPAHCSTCLNICASSAPDLHSTTQNPAVYYYSNPDLHHGSTKPSPVCYLQCQLPLPRPLQHLPPASALHHTQPWTTMHQLNPAYTTNQLNPHLCDTCSFSCPCPAHCSTCFSPSASTL
jgi:hypothetical protein